MHATAGSAVCNGCAIIRQSETTLLTRFAAAAIAQWRPLCFNLQLGCNFKGYKISSPLFSIILTTTLAGLISITAAAIFSYAVLSRMVDRLVSLSVGIMLSTSLLHALPEAFESGADPRKLFICLLGGLLAFSCWKSGDSASLASP
jgi:hypothetical protein